MLKFDDYVVWCKDGDMLPGIIVGINKRPLSYTLQVATIGMLDAPAKEVKLQSKLNASEQLILNKFVIEQGAQKYLYGPDKIYITNDLNLYDLYLIFRKAEVKNKNIIDGIKSVAEAVRTSVSNEMRGFQQ